MYGYLLFFRNSLEQNLISVPNSLDISSSSGNWTVGLSLFAGLLLISLSRVYEANYLRGLVAAYFSPSTRADIQKVDLNLSSLSSIIILLNAFIGFSTCLYLFISGGEYISLEKPMLWAISGALLFLILQLGMMSFTALVTGEFGKMRDLFVQTILNIQFSGLFFFLFGSLWFLNPSYSLVFAKLFIVVVFLTSVVRLLKGIFASLTNGISWYYIILYFCTLEILPLFILYIMVGKYLAF
jgi:hypothetical protein